LDDYFLGNPILSNIPLALILVLELLFVKLTLVNITEKVIASSERKEPTNSLLSLLTMFGGWKSKVSSSI
jgi:hypothetical protein